MTLTELQNSKKIALFHSAGYINNVSCNTPRVVHQYRVELTTSTGKMTIGKASNGNKSEARAAAWEAALQFANS